MAAKRSPILGYNHNVRFRGIVFHIQTEDSGIINPHVFTHLFHGGVIISTRKLVYDPDANDEAVKALMQAQHKAVMKDLKRGTFDDKIDSYLGGTEGLLPRESAISVAAPRPVPAAVVDEPVEAAAIDEPPVAPPAVAPDATPQLEIIDALSEPIELPLKVRPPAPEPEPPSFWARSTGSGARPRPGSCGACWPRRGRCGFWAGPRARGPPGCSLWTLCSSNTRRR